MIRPFKFINCLLALCIALLFLIYSCVNNDDFDHPPVVCNHPDFVSNSSIHDLLEMNLFKFMPTLITDDIILEGHVISSDRQGNFFKTLSIQNKEEGRGFQIELDVNDLYIQFPVGQKVFVRAKNLFISDKAGVLKIGHTFKAKEIVRVGRIQETLVDEFVFRTCDDISLVKPLVFNNILNVISKDEYLNTLITLENVQFLESEMGKNYAEKDKSGDRILEDSSGNKIILRTSNFAAFAHDSLPKGSGKITAVLGKFRDNCQLYIRDLEDVKMNNSRFVVKHSALQICINEFHYDDDGRDENEFVEIRISGNEASQPTNLESFTIALYNGEDGKEYRMTTLDRLSKACDDKYCYYVWETSIQNGPDGIAIAGPSIKEFLSYEDSFTAKNSIVNGMISTDIGVFEDGTDLGGSLQIDPTTEGDWKLSAQNTKKQANRIE